MSREGRRDKGAQSICHLDLQICVFVYPLYFLFSFRQEGSNSMYFFSLYFACHACESPNQDDSVAREDSHQQATLNLTSHWWGWFSKDLISASEHHGGTLRVQLRPVAGAWPDIHPCTSASAYCDHVEADRGIIIVDYYQMLCMSPTTVTGVFQNFSQSGWRARVIYAKHKTWL